MSACERTGENLNIRVFTGARSVPGHFRKSMVASARSVLHPGTDIITLTCHV